MIVAGAIGMGFQRNAQGTFSVVMDEGYGGDHHNTSWLPKLTQRYAYHVAKDTLEEKGFDLVEEETEENQEIHLMLRRMA